MNRLLTLLIAAIVSYAVLTEPPKPEVWKAISHYGGTFAVYDAQNKEITADLNSYWILRHADTEARKRKVKVKLEYYSEEDTGLEKVKPWGRPPGPTSLPHPEWETKGEGP